jgi:thioredoxin 1
MSIVNLTDDNFKTEVLEAGEPVLVDFWAEWCGPCKAIAPILDQIAEEYKGRVKIAKLNVDELQALAMEYSVRSIPTLILFKDGAVEAQQIGLKSKAELTTLLDNKL